MLMYEETIKNQVIWGGEFRVDFVRSGKNECGAEIGGTETRESVSSVKP
jgi:hypothetical protein